MITTIPAVPVGHIAVASLTVKPGLTRPDKPSTYTVKEGDYLAGISGRYCGTEGDYMSLAAASGIKDPDLIFPKELVKLACHHAYAAVAAAIAQQPVQQAQQPVQHTQQSTPSPASSQPSQPVLTSLSGTLSFSGLEALWVAAGGPADAEYDAATVAECESGGQQYAHNPSGADGYWQILGEVVAGDIFDPMVNAENAVSKFEASGDTFAQWVCRP